jgi:CHC2 zinc finger
MISKPPILDVIAARVNLQRVGGRLRGLCPFHTEKTPSFTVDEEKRRDVFTASAVKQRAMSSPLFKRSTV